MSEWVSTFRWEWIGEQVITNLNVLAKPSNLPDRKNGYIPRGSWSVWFFPKLGSSSVHSVLFPSLGVSCGGWRRVESSGLQRSSCDAPPGCGGWAGWITPASSTGYIAAAARRTFTSRRPDIEPRPAFLPLAAAQLTARPRASVAFSAIYHYRYHCCPSRVDGARRRKWTMEKRLPSAPIPDNRYTRVSGKSPRTISFVSGE